MFHSFSQSLFGFLLSNHLSLDKVGVSFENLLLISPSVLHHVKRLVNFNSLQVKVSNELRLNLQDILSSQLDGECHELQCQRIVSK